MGAGAPAAPQPARAGGRTSVPSGHLARNFKTLRHLGVALWQLLMLWNVPATLSRRPGPRYVGTCPGATSPCGTLLSPTKPKSGAHGSVRLDHSNHKHLSSLQMTPVNVLSEL